MVDEIYDPDTEDSIIPRGRVFVLLDGTFVVRWSENRVQELESGHYRGYDPQDFGAHITDYELKQLKSAGLVKRFDKERVWLCPLPERRALSLLTSWEVNRTRSYYLNTTLPGESLQDIVRLLENLGLAESFDARARDDFVVLWGSKGISFHKFDDAEKARSLLVSKSPEAFGNTVVAFVETTKKG